MRTMPRYAVTPAAPSHLMRINPMGVNMKVAPMSSATYRAMTILTTVRGGDLTPRRESQINGAAGRFPHETNWLSS